MYVSSVSPARPRALLVAPILMENQVGHFALAVHFEGQLRIHNLQKKSFSVSANTSNLAVRSIARRTDRHLARRSPFSHEEKGGRKPTRAICFEHRSCSSGKDANRIYSVRNARIGSFVLPRGVDQTLASAFVIIALAYSARRESTGFTFAARNDGTTLATTVASAGSAAAPARVTGSHDFRPKSNVLAPRPASSANVVPRTTPS